MSSKIAVLVTGGAGYIGSQTCKALASAGYIPITLDNLSTGTADLVKWGPLEVGDIVVHKIIELQGEHYGCNYVKTIKK